MFFYVSGDRSSNALVNIVQDTLKCSNSENKLVALVKMTLAL